MTQRFPLAVVLSAVDKLSGPLGKVEGRLGKLGKGLTKAGRNLTLSVTAPLLAAGVATIGVASRFEESMNTVAAITDSVGSPAFGKLRDQAKELGRTTQFTAAQAADGMTELSIAGFKATEILSSTPRVLNLAAASGLELAQSAEIAAGTLRAAGLEVKELDRVTDVLTGGFTKSAVKLEDLSEGLKLSLPVLSGMGISLEENVALLGALGNNMFRGSLAGTALKRAASSLANATPVTQATLERLEIFREDLVDAGGNVVSMIRVIELLEEKGATTADVLRIFGERAGPAMNALVRTGAKGIRELEQQLSVSGSTARIAEVRMQGAAGGMRALRSATEGLAIAIADSGLLETFTGIVDRLTRWVQRMTETNPELLRMGTVLAVVAAAAGPVLFVGGKLITLFGVLATAAKALGVALLFLTTNPIGLTITAIAAVVAGGVLLVKNWKTIKAAASSVWTFVRNTVGGALGWIRDKLASLVDLVPDWLLGLLPGGRAAGAIARGGFTGAPVGASAAAAPHGPPIVGASGGRRDELLERRESTVRIEIPNLPPGARVETSGDPLAELDLGLGLSMAT